MELQKIQLAIKETVEKQDRRAKVETLIQQCQEALTLALEVNDELFAQAKKTAQKPEAIKELERWVLEVTEGNDIFLQNAREYLDRTPQAIERKPSSFQSFSQTSAASKAGNSSAASKTSSQRRRGLLLAQARREAVEQEVQADLSLAKKKQELELAQLKEVGRRKVTEAELQELEFQDTEDEEVEEETGSKIADEQRVNDWVNSVPFGIQESLAPVITSGTLLTPAADPNAFGGQLERDDRVHPSPSTSTVFQVAKIETRQVNPRRFQL